MESLLQLVDQRKWIFMECGTDRTIMWYGYLLHHKTQVHSGKKIWRGLQASLWQPWSQG